MPWPWRRRQSSAKRPAARHAIPRQGKSWAEPAFPPAPAPPAPAQTAAPAVGVPVQASSVLLGFTDGSQVALDERDPHAVALREVANILSQPAILARPRRAR